MSYINKTFQTFKCHLSLHKFLKCMFATRTKNYSAWPNCKPEMAFQMKMGKISKVEEAIGIKGAHLFGPSVESKFDELKYEIVHKIDKELSDSQNARDYISQKYDELCNKIQYLTELDATVTGFRSDVKAIETQITELSSRVDSIEKKALFKECPSLSSSMF